MIMDDAGTVPDVSAGTHLPLRGRIGASVNPDLIYDVGANDGADTAHYLSRGFRVVAIEANPALARRLRKRFAQDARVIVLNVGVGPREGVQPFYVNAKNDEWSAFDPEMGQRGGRSTTIPVECVRFPSILAEYGVPYYLKVDIERADVHCIEALDPSDLPEFTSIEAHSLGYLATLYTLGYRRFKVVDQPGHNHPRTFQNETVWGRAIGRVEWYRRRFMNHSGLHQPYAPGSSGPFGHDTPGPWLDLETVAYEWLHIHTGHTRRGSLNPRGWFDFHATR